MIIQILTPNKALNKAYLKEKVSRNDIETFKTNFKTLLSKINEGESEEHHKYPVADFLKDTWYKDNNYINTKERADFVIHNGKTARESVGVILEVKSPTNAAEMISADKPNKKALQELVFYYLRERIEHKNTELKHLVITNIYEWYIFDEAWFEKNVYQNTHFRKGYEAYIQNGKNTRFFYESIAKPGLEAIDATLSCAYVNLRNYEKYVRNDDSIDDKKLIPLYKILSPAHLLKQSFANDSNTLDTKFYTELLHIIGLEEVKDGGKKLIRRKATPDTASLLESAIMRLEDKDSLRNITGISAFGATRQEQLFGVALELCITWVNRILFIKLLEGQLVTYNKGNRDYRFLNSGYIHDYDELNDLFFSVLAERPATRRPHVREKFARVPYLNSSLFDRTKLEREAIEVDVLDNRMLLPLHAGTVLKNEQGKRKTGELTTLQYLFEFLDAYDFSSDGGEEIQEENKNLINASVLGLIFEKINGYKDGSFFTPGFITMYMCRETIRRAVLQKFKDAKGWDCSTLDELHDRIDIKDKTEANTIINTLRICDPAVGSGHFLVSALNEVIAIKSELKILQDRQHKTLRDYHIEVVNDELVITDEDGNLLDYNPRNPESRRIQEALFHEKETIIENCLFGVDINPNSVKICRLRLWIELLKNTYYTADSNYTELETLPNIDINIKCGNSLISRFPLDADLSQALKKSNWNIDSYRIAVHNYRNAETKEEKRDMEQLIEDIKGNFRSEIGSNDPKIKKLQKLNREYYHKYQADTLFAAKLTKEQKKHKADLEKELEKLDTEIKEIKTNKIYENAFEWRFEFPEVLDSDGRFVGFDMVIGNPPYGIMPGIKDKEYFSTYFPATKKFPDSYCSFIVLAQKLLSSLGGISFIVPNTFCDLESCYDFRKWMLKHFSLKLFWQTGFAFDNAVVDTIVFHAINEQVQDDNILVIIGQTEYIRNTLSFECNDLMKFDYRNNQIKNSFLRALLERTCRFESIGIVKAGVKLYEVGKGTPPQTKDTLKGKPFTCLGAKPEGWRILIRGADINRYQLSYSSEYVNYGEWLAAPREGTTFSGSRIIMRRTDDRLLSTFVNDNSVCVNSCHIIKLVNTDDVFYKAVLAILNSSFIQKIFEIQNPQMVGKTFAEIKVTYISQLPFPFKIVHADQLSKYVDQILFAKESNPLIDTSSIENEIDQLVYQLYGLTEEEIKIVEGTN